jgi:hypothetical protein
MQRVMRANRAYLAYKVRRDALDDSDDDEGPDNEDAWLFEDLNVLMKLMVRKKEKEQLLALIFEVGRGWIDCTSVVCSKLIFGLGLFTPIYSGNNGRAVEGYHHHFLFSARHGLQGC